MDLRTGQPYWPVLNGLLHTYPPLATDEQADIAVIGAHPDADLVRFGRGRGIMRRALAALPGVG